MTANGTSYKEIFFKKSHNTIPKTIIVSKIGNIGNNAAGAGIHANITFSTKDWTYTGFILCGALAQALPTEG